MHDNAQRTARERPAVNGIPRRTSAISTLLTSKKTYRHTRVTLRTKAIRSPETSAPAIERIRVEMLSTEMPVHQLAKTSREEIKIVRRSPNGGQVSLYWKVEPSATVGHPGPLAYRLDTWVIKRRLDQLRRPIPRLVRIGDLREIARDLDCGGDTNTVKRAFEQNASAFIRAKVAYRDADGREQSLEGYFNRYNVFFRGQSLPGGAKAETVYISLNDPYYALINGATWRPLDYQYLRTLTPSAQRWYELVSPKMFAAIKNGHPTAWIRYSDFCALAVARPQRTKQRMQSQMAAIHRAHLAAGYLDSVSWRADRTADDVPDCSIHYVPGPRAIEEFDAFNGVRRQRPIYLDRDSHPRAPSTSVSPSQASERTPEEESASDQLARHFLKVRHGASGSSITPPQRARAREILSTLDGDLDAAFSAVELASEAASRDPKGYPRHLGGVLEGGFVECAKALAAERRQRADAEEARRREEALHRQYQEWCRRRADGRVAALGTDERRHVVADRSPRLLADFRFYIRQRGWSEENARDWAEPRILGRYGHEGEPSFEEWRRTQELEPTGASGPSEALQ